jgi:hypothetical protein
MTRARSVSAISGTVIGCAAFCLALIVSGCKGSADTSPVPSVSSVPTVPPVDSAPTADADGGDILPKSAKPPASSAVPGGKDGSTDGKIRPPLVPDTGPPSEEPGPPAPGAPSEEP